MASTERSDEFVPMTKLEDLPNIGPAIAADLRSIGIRTPAELFESDPLPTFEALAKVMGQRHDPCVFYTLLAVKHFAQSGQSVPWWTFTEEGKKILAIKNARHDA